ncbi:ABC transporter permease subunit [Rummeliibacillus sp. NPDC094406]|uniref:ABC transporter permease subunit n=1 Tax=Rummeliibacillus sp. NPDC094406 TaxID=3364511 RepID=UPI00381CA72B
MSKLFLFEYKKILKKKVTWITFLLSFIAVISFYFYSMSVSENIKSQNINKLDYIISSYKKMILDINSEKDKSEQDKDVENVKMLSTQIKGLKKSIKQYETQKENLIKGNWQEIYSNEATSLEKQLSPEFNIASRSIENQEISNFTIKATFAEVTWLQKKNVEPFIQKTVYTPYVASIYDHFTGSVLDEWKTTTERYSTNGLSLLFLLIQQYFIPIVILLGCFIFANTISSDTNSKKKGLNFYFTLPIYKRKIYFAKYLSGITFTMGFVLVITITPLICSLFSGGIGSLHSPVLVYEIIKPNLFGAVDDTKAQFHLIELKDYLQQLIPLAILLVLFLYSFYFMLSTIIRNSIVSVCIVSIVSFGAMKLYPTVYNPFTYMDLHKIINSELSTTLFKASINLQNGLSTLVIMGCISSIIGYFLFKKVNTNYYY